MNRKTFEQVVREALDGLPEEIAQYLEDHNVSVVVQDRPSREQLEDEGIDDPMGLYGLYEGTPFTERSLLESGSLPDRITVYQRPLELDFPDRGELIHEIQVTVAHELAHAFGIDEERLAELGLE
ncbi:MAG TPA: metallopeptidase family protein [Candidatus Saccharimonadales bacterium]|nr:metallopeptidase family protein [Candidatus Saccharimonadales bacterium]